MAGAVGRDEGLADAAARPVAGIFVSYAREDRHAARRVADALERSGRSVWIDLDDLPFGEEFPPAIEAAIEAADAVVFVLSSDFAASRYCQRELEHALANHKRLVPVVVRDVDPVTIATELATLNWIRLTGDDDFVAGVEAIERTADTDYAWLRQHTHLLVRAQEWTARGEPPSLVLRGETLRGAERWLSDAAGKEPPPAPVHARFLVASRRAASRRQRGTIGAISAALVVAVALAIVAIAQRNRAVDESRQARSRELAAEALKVIDTQPDLATMLAVEAADNAWTTEAISAVRRSVMQPHLTGTVHRRNQPIARSPDNRWIVYRKSKGSILVVERGSGRAGRTPRRTARGRPQHHVLAGRGAARNGIP